MPSVTDLLRLAGVKYEPFARANRNDVYLTAGNQLIGTYAELCAFRRVTSDYHGWQAHHVVETHDLTRLHIAQFSPGRDDQLCVLLPERAHIGRINSVLRNHAPIGSLIAPRELLNAYREAYALTGDYCGGGEILIRRELVSIVHATFHAFSLV